MDYEPKVISTEGEAAVKLIEQRFRPLLEVAQGEVRALMGEGRWEAVIESGVLDYVPEHSVSFSVRCCRECCDEAPAEARHELSVWISTHFLDGDRPLTHVTLTESGFSYEAFLQMKEDRQGSDASERFAPDDPAIEGEVGDRIAVLLRVLRKADAIREGPWWERE